MKALVFHGPGKVIYENYVDPVIDGPGQAIIRVRRCSICGSDLHLLHGAAFGGLDFSKEQTPFCMGHEFAGEIVDIGPGVSKRKIGERVISAPGFGCGECAPCLGGWVNGCERSEAYCYGVTPGVQGGQAEYVKVFHADQTTYAVPDFVDDEQAMLLTDALSTGYYGARRARVSPGSTVAVIGLGPVGLMAVESAFALGAERVYGIDPVESRRAAAVAVGAIPLVPGEAVDEVRSGTRGAGVDHVIEAVGAVETVTLALNVVRRTGDIGIVGVMPSGAGIDLGLAQYNTVSINPALAPVIGTWPEIIAHIEAGRIRGANVFTHRFALSDGAKAYEVFDRRADNVMKVMIELPD